MTPSRVRTLTRRLAPPADHAARAADADLLGRFLDARDEAAFTALVSRHLPTVRAVCRSVLRDPNDADDATQATFLVLVRRAGTVRDRAALGAWLARVAWRAANRLRETNTRRAAGRSHTTDPDDTPARAPADRSALTDAMNEEIARLPERYRLAVLTCYAAGTPTADAARQLGWPKGTLLTRLAWARRRLRQRLDARGLAPAGGLAVVFAPRAGRVGAALLAERIGQAGLLLSTGDPLAKVVIPGRVASLTEGVVRAMIVTKLKLLAAAGLVAVALLGLGLGRMTADGQPPAGAKAAQTPPAPAADRKEPAAKADPDRPAPALAPADLVVRRPVGSYTKEVPQYGKATLTFTENRLHVRAAVRIEKATLTVEADADYAMNRESVVYGVFTSVELAGVGGQDDAVVGSVAAEFVDSPFSFRVRVEYDGVSIKDVRCGGFGSPSSGADEKLRMVTLLVCGKYRTDPNPVRPALPAPAVPTPTR